MSRTFQAVDAVRKESPLFLCIFSPSGGGKTRSALELATGIQSVYGRDIVVIDTENGRALHYAPPDFPFKFKHVPFTAPFGPLDYLEAMNFALAMKPGVIIIDQLSYEWDGTGGVLESHDAELTRMAGNDWKKREQVNFTAWIRPKADHKKLINAMMQASASTAFIFNFRAAEKTQIVKGPDGKTKPVEAGFMPIGSRDFVFEALCSFFLPPRSDGKPDFDPALPGEKLMVKTPGQFRTFLKAGAILNQEMGAKLAEWAKGGKVTANQAAMDAQAPATSQAVTVASGAQISQMLDLHTALEDSKDIGAMKMAARLATLLKEPDKITTEKAAEAIEKSTAKLEELKRSAVA